MKLIKCAIAPKPALSSELTPLYPKSCNLNGSESVLSADKLK